MNTTIPCKVCAGPAPLHGPVDFNRSCEVARGVYLPLLGEEVWYYRCQGCGFLFTDHFDAWDGPRWREQIYNDDYAKIDPDGASGQRASANARLVCDLAHQIGTSSILDYGGGDGTLARLLVTRGFDAYSIDAFHGGHAPPGPVPLVTAFEVIEHSPTPAATVAEIMSWLRPGGRVLFSTLVCDNLPPQDMSSFYIAPRNGHVSIHTRGSLDILFAAHNYRVAHVGDVLHLAEPSLAIS